LSVQLKFALAVFKVATDQKFDIFIMLIILLNMFTMAIEYYQAPTDIELVLHYVNVVFVAIFTAECLIKLVGLRHYYFKNPWNVFDFAVVVMSIVGQSLFASCCSSSSTVRRSSFDIFSNF